jgi:hypothetical protein
MEHVKSLRVNEGELDSVAERPGQDLNQAELL